MANSIGPWLRMDRRGDVFEMLDSVETCILGRVMYPLYEHYWMAVLAKPSDSLALSGKPATKNEIK
jgi:hypothetical protein